MQPQFSLLIRRLNSKRSDLPKLGYRTLPKINGCDYLKLHAPDFSSSISIPDNQPGGSKDITSPMT
jgi:hypothetical protein